MKFIFLFISILFLANCSKPKTVLICGDHICINKDEAEQYFQENLSIEVKLVDKKVKNEIDLVELNLKEHQNGKKKISVLSIKNTNKDLKTLSNEEINKIKKNIKIKSKEKKIAKKIFSKKQKIRNEKNKKIIKKEKIIDQKENKFLKENVNKKRNDIVDICTILEKCSIDEISKYLLKKGEKKGFPNITTK